MEPTRSPGQRAGLTHERVMRAAHELLARDGLDALTMRALAHSLGVSPNALYSHVATKTALVDELLDDLLAEVETPDPETEDWQAGLRTMMASTHAVLLTRPDLVPLYLARQGARGPNARRLGDVMLALLARGGITGAPAVDAQRALIVHAIGSAAFASGDASAGPPRPEIVHTFDQGLEWLLAGIEATVSPAPRPGRRRA